MTPRKPAPWGEAHRREAAARLLELSAEYLRRPGGDIVSIEMTVAGTEATFRAACGTVKLGKGRVDREVRRVRDLAEGRKMRDTVWRVRCPDDAVDLEEARARMIADQIPGATVVRVTRIRRVR